MTSSSSGSWGCWEGPWPINGGGRYLNLENSSTPYDVPVALAWLKVPLGAFTAILGVLAISASFVPGLSVLDSQAQILTYALLLAYGQQAFTGVLERRAQSLNDEVPSKENKVQHPGAVTPHSPDSRSPAAGAGGG